MTDPKIKAFLDLIAFSEGTSTHPQTKHDGYDVIVTGVDGMHTFDDFSDHPFAAGRPAIRFGHGPKDLSTASGRYQQMLHNWRVYKVALGLKDFGPESQDKIALQEMSEVHAMQKVDDGDLKGAIVSCASRWASFPGNSYHQNGGKSLDTLVAKYAELLASVA